MKYWYIFVGILSISLQSCATDDSNFQIEIAKSKWLHQSMDKLTDVIVHDIFSPPVASRIYVYPSIAAYEVIAASDPSYKSLAGQLKEMPALPSPEKEIYKEIAVLEAFLNTSQTLIFSEKMIADYKVALFSTLQEHSFDSEKWKNSIAYGKQISQLVLSWADKDKYKQSRSYPKYSIQNTTGTWKPTPPTYMQGIEPSWMKIRPMVLDSAEQFKPIPPTEYSLAEDSQFYRELMEVYETVKNANEEEINIASFWDCNPYVMNQTGHVMYATKKITPGGHWMGISRIASEGAEDDIARATKTYALVSIGLFDGFISCWDEKYRSILVRPETVINEHYDENWVPLLQTPPFPEYTSGHSVISTAAAVVLTDIYGDKMGFEDSVELKYGLPIRTFDNFLQASEEAAISRLYGGIHYMPAIVEGQKQGRKVGELVIQKIQLK